MFGAAYKNSQFIRRAKEEDEKKAGILYLGPYSFKQGMHQIYLVADPTKNRDGYHLDTTHRVEKVLDDQSPDEILCTESQRERKDCLCPICLWYNEFADDQEDENGTPGRKSLRTRMLEYAQNNPKSRRTIEEVLESADRIGIFESRILVFVGVALNAKHVQEPRDKEDPSKGNWDNIVEAKNGEGKTIPFVLKCKGKDQRFFDQIDSMMKTFVSSKTGKCLLVDPEKGRVINFEVNKSYHKKLSPGEKRPLTPDEMKVLNDVYPNVEAWGQSKHKGKGSGNKVKSFEMMKSKLINSYFYKQIMNLNNKWGIALLAKKPGMAEALNAENYTEDMLEDTEPGIGPDGIEHDGDPEDWRPSEEDEDDEESVPWAAGNEESEEEEDEDE